MKNNRLFRSAKSILLYACWFSCFMTFAVELMANKPERVIKASSPDAMALPDSNVVVLVNFEIDKKGKVKEIKILSNECTACTNDQRKRMEAVVFKLISEKSWTPGSRNGRPVKVRYNLPVRFAVIGDSVYVPAAGPKKQPAKAQGYQLVTGNSQPRPCYSTF